jgi:dihydrofolate synthase/folylpolyglutamate synthase
VTWILDVAHNEQAARALAANLRSLDCTGRLHAVLGMLRGKDPAGVAEPLAGLVDAWHLAPTRDTRAMPGSELHAALEGAVSGAVAREYADIDEALAAAEAEARPGDCILAFGSFTTVSAALIKVGPTSAVSAPDSSEPDSIRETHRIAAS